MFKLISYFKPRGDQPQAIEKLVSGIDAGHKNQVLLGVTGSGKTYTMASVIEKTNLPTLIVSPNKTLASQLYQEFKQFFPENSVQYFVSYYDYYQPEAFIPQTNTYIQKDARVNAEIDKLRHAAIQSVLARPDTIVIASVSCIYGIGDPNEYQRSRLELKINQIISTKDLFRHLNYLQYIRNDESPKLGEFSINKDKIILHLVTDEKIEIVIAKRKIISLKKIHPSPSTNSPINQLTSLLIYPAKFWVTPQNRLKLALGNIKTELEERVEELQSAGKFEEAERLEKKTLFDIEMLSKKGHINGIENYSRHLGFRNPGEPPLTLIDYFPKPFLLFVDESHISVPQLQAMEAGDKQRKSTLIEYGFRLPSALDNRPLRFDEFESKIGQAIHVSATPGPNELTITNQVVEQVVRPTGILDPEIIVRPASNQVKDLLKEIKNCVQRGGRVLALTLTKRSAEDLTEYLLQENIKTNYLHSEIKTLDRPKILADLRRGKIDVIVGINLLREGLDLPEVSLVAVLDADREGFLRNYRGIMQMAGRAARSTTSKVILYGDSVTQSMDKVIKETKRRRKIQTDFNKKFSIIPTTIKKPIMESLSKSV
ncbi:MAG: excinuclease ABC subunit UvrB [bacterium]|nr:excinuclease ABC subunit UvrB [bacterium]